MGFRKRQLHRHMQRSKRVQESVGALESINRLVRTFGLPAVPAVYGAEMYPGQGDFSSTAA